MLLSAVIRTIKGRMQGNRFKYDTSVHVLSTSVLDRRSRTVVSAG
jgi:hypothetical protein